MLQKMDVDLEEHKSASELEQLLPFQHFKPDATINVSKRVSNKILSLSLLRDTYLKQRALIESQIQRAQTNLALYAQSTRLFEQQAQHHTLQLTQFQTQLATMEAELKQLKQTWQHCNSVEKQIVQEKENMAKVTLQPQRQPNNDDDHDDRDDGDDGDDDARSTHQDESDAHQRHPRVESNRHCSTVNPPTSTQPNSSTQQPHNHASSLSKLSSSSSPPSSSASSCVLQIRKRDSGGSNRSGGNSLSLMPPSRSQSHSFLPRNHAPLVANHTNYNAQPPASLNKLQLAMNSIHSLRSHNEFEQFSLTTLRKPSPHQLQPPSSASLSSSSSSSCSSSFSSSSSSCGHPDNWSHKEEEASMARSLAKGDGVGKGWGGRVKLIADSDISRDGVPGVTARMLRIVPPPKNPGAFVQNYHSNNRS